MTYKDAPRTVKKDGSHRQIVSAGSREPITFTAQNLNTAAQPVVFTTDDPTWGKLLFTATNDSSEVVTLSTASVLAVYLDSLLTDDEISKITCATTTWAGGPVTNDLGAHLELSPRETVTLLPEESAQIEVAGALAGGPPITGYFIFDYSGFSGVPDGTCRIQGFRQATPTSTVPWPLNLSWAPRAAYQELGNTVYVTPWTGPAGIDNSFILQLENTQSSPIAFPAGMHPRIVVSFVAGSSPLGLCSDEQLKKVDAAVAQSDGPWTVTVDRNGPLPIFIATPNDGNINLFDGGGILAIAFSGLVTELSPGYASPVFVQYGGLLPTYADGYSSLVINKTAPTPYVTRFEVNGVDGAVSANDVVTYGPLTVTWDVFAAQSCILQGVPTVFPPSSSYTFTPVLPFPAYVDCHLQSHIGSAIFDGAELAFTMAPPPPIGITINAYAPTPVWPDMPLTVGVTWSTTNATSCQVLRLDDGSEIGSTLNGDWGATGKTVPTHFRIVATGPAGTVQQDCNAW